MECPKCTLESPDENLFCEECGEPLQELEPIPSCVCGAPLAEADEDGFCGRCGRRVRPRETDRMEAELSRDLAAVSDKGIRHDRNEDRFAIRRFDNRTLLAVCDGVSASRESELASSLAVETIAESIGAGATLEQAMRHAAEAVAKLGPRGNGDAPSTTAVAALIDGDTVALAWVGDSRAYWIDDAGAHQLSSDHSWMNQIVAAGEMTVEQAGASPRAHAITRWFGADAEDDAWAETTRFKIPGPGLVLLCTDGLWNYSPTLAASDDSVLELCRKLVDFANRCGGLDNITVAALRISPIDVNQKA